MVQGHVILINEDVDRAAVGGMQALGEEGEGILDEVVFLSGHVAQMFAVEKSAAVIRIEIRVALHGCKADEGIFQAARTAYPLPPRSHGP